MNQVEARFSDGFKKLFSYLSSPEEAWKLAEKMRNHPDTTKVLLKTIGSPWQVLKHEI